MNAFFAQCDVEKSNNQSSHLAVTCEVMGGPFKFQSFAMYTKPFI